MLNTEPEVRGPLVSYSRSQHLHVNDIQWELSLWLHVHCETWLVLTSAPLAFEINQSWLIIDIYVCASQTFITAATFLCQLDS